VQRLTAREQQIFDLLAQGKTRAQIASELGLASAQDISNRVKFICLKKGFESLDELRAHCARLASEVGSG
jgi:DNA-binding NarL/FixJ family response regulator